MLRDWSVRAVSAGASPDGCPDASCEVLAGAVIVAIVVVVQGNLHKAKLKKVCGSTNMDIFLRAGGQIFF